LSNWNLKSFDNLHASLAESAYRYRPKNFPYEQLNESKKNRLNSGKSVEFNFSTDGKDSEGQVTHGGGTDLPNGGKVYLQPDNKKLLEDEETGYHAYYVTDTDTINANTHQTYFAIRGSDGFGFNLSQIKKGNFKEFNYQDWINNDAAFALTDAIVPKHNMLQKG